MKKQSHNKEPQLRRIVKRAQRKVDSKFDNVAWLNNRFKQSTRAYVRITEKRPPKDVLFDMATLLDKTFENSKRNKEKHESKVRTREEWEQLERVYVGKPLPLEEGMKYCRAWDCINQIVATGRKEYCSKRCRHEQKAAVKRLAVNGTLLPVEVYKGIREESVFKKQDKHEQYTEYIETFSNNNPYDLRTIGARRKKIRPTIESKQSHKVHVRLNDEDTKSKNVFTVSIKTGVCNVHNEEKFRNIYRLVE